MGGLNCGSGGGRRTDRMRDANGQPAQKINLVLSTIVDGKEDRKISQAQSVPFFLFSSPGTVDIKETFRLSLATSPITIDVQEVTGMPKRLSSVRIEVDDVQELADWALSQFTTHMKINMTEAALLGEQFHACTSLERESEREKVDRMWKYGFKPLKLSQGGYIWL